MHDSQPVSVQSELAQCQEDTTRRLEQFKPVLAGKRLLDVGCGAGSFLMAAREYAQSVAGVEPETGFQKHFSEHGLTVFKSIEDISSSYEFDIATLFHVLEHIKDPIAFLTQVAGALRDRNSNHNKLCVIEVPHANDALLTLYKNKKFSEFTYWSCHLYLFTEKN